MKASNLWGERKIGRLQLNRQLIASSSDHDAGFFAPEMIMTGSYEGDKADVWSTGCILLELLFGRRRYDQHVTDL